MSVKKPNFRKYLTRVYRLKIPKVEYFIERVEKSNGKIDRFSMKRPSDIEGVSL